MSTESFSPHSSPTLNATPGPIRSAPGSSKISPNLLPYTLRASLFLFWSSNFQKLYLFTSTFISVSQLLVQDADFYQFCKFYPSNFQIAFPVSLQLVLCKGEVKNILSVRFGTVQAVILSINASVGLRNVVMVPIRGSSIKLQSLNLISSTFCVLYDYTHTHIG